MASPATRTYRPTEAGMLTGTVVGLLGGLLLSVLTRGWWVLPIGLPIGIALGLGIGAAVEARRNRPPRSQR